MGIVKSKISKVHKRVGVIDLGYDVSKKPVFMRVCGHQPNRQIVFATLLQHDASEKTFATDEIIVSGFAKN